jgi:hypothetical protein
MSLSLADSAQLERELQAAEGEVQRKLIDAHSADLNYW